MKILFINCKNHRRCLNETLLHDAVKSLGHEIEILPWDDVGPNHKCDVAVIRLTWDYVERVEEFRTWMKRMENAKFPIFNDLKLIEWNLNKKYLAELANNGIAVPKSFIWEGKYLPHWVDFETELGPPPYVFKPLVSSGGKGTFLVHGDVSYSAAIARMNKAAFIAQEFLRDVRSGEISIAVFDGKFSHATKKVPQEGDFRVHSEYGGSVHPYTPSKDEIAWAEYVIANAPISPLIARVDYVLKLNKPMLMELEIFEPELFFDTHPNAAKNLATAIVSRASGRITR